MRRRKYHLKYKSRKPGILTAVIFLLFFGITGYIGYFFSDKYHKDKLSGSSNYNREIAVSISGEIRWPGNYSVPEGSRTADLIEKAGGLADNADLDDIKFTQRLAENQNVNIPGKKSLFKKLGVGRAPEETYLIPPLEVEEVK